VPQCLECGIVEGPLGQYHTCRACLHESRRYQPETEIRIPASSLVAGAGKQELHFSVQKNRGRPGFTPGLQVKRLLEDKGTHLELVDIETGRVLKTIPRKPRTRFEREDPI